MGGPRYDIDEIRRAYDATPPAATGALFWQLVADQLGRSARGVYRRAVEVEGWAPKVLRPKPCVACKKRFTWDQFADGGRIRVCKGCVDDVLEGRR
jgi:hypothetical protein